MVASDRSWAPSSQWFSRSLSARIASRSAVGTPITSHITSFGRAAPKSAKSKSGSSHSGASRARASARTRGSMVATQRGLNAPPSSRRSLP
jgi:hypothetical protein